MHHGYLDSWVVLFKVFLLSKVTLDPKLGDIEPLLRRIWGSWEYLFVTFSSINGHINLFNVYFYILVKIYCWFADIQLTAVHPWRELIWHTFSLRVITFAQGLQTAPQRCAGGILNNKITKTHKHAKQCGTEPTTEGHLFTLWGRKQWVVKLAPPQWETHTSGKPHLPSSEVCKWPWRHLEPWLGIASRSFS